LPKKATKRYHFSEKGLKILFFSGQGARAYFSPGKKVYRHPWPDHQNLKKLPLILNEPM
jgi:hypothetical protein